MQTVKQLAVHPSPAGRPQPIAFHEGALWVGCWDASSLYAIDPATWTVRDAVPLPGVPYGLASLGGALHVVVSIGDADDRWLYRLVPGSPLDEAGRVPCPELTGSHLTSDGSRLYLVQQSLRRLVELDERGAAVREHALPVRCGGAAFRGATFHLLAADAEFDEVELATLDVEVAGANPARLGAVHPESRGLAFDGTAWWTCRRELGEIVSFA